MSLNTTLSSFGELVFPLWPYFASYLFLKCGLLGILTILGFGSTGILPYSIASWIQSIHGTSYLFSCLQSIGARSGILYPKFWSGIIGTTYTLIVPSAKWSSDPNSFFETNKSKQTHSGYKIDVIFFFAIIVLGAIVSTGIMYFRRRQNNSQQITTNRTVRVHRPAHQLSTEVIQEHPQRLRDTSVPIHTRNRNSSLKVTDILHPNSSGDRSCPQCRKKFKPQGITNHVKSCAKEWCRTNGIDFTGTE